MLPLDGGFDVEGNLTRDPGAIEASQRALPVGYWKGSGLSIVLDMAAAMLSAGRATHQIAADPLRETAVSQVFVAINPEAVGGSATIADEIVASLHRCAVAEPGKRVRYPGEQTLRTREQNRQLGLPVDEAVWAEILAI
jgi:3-dehydro-L-gulonate 2-dehydrogenase